MAFTALYDACVLYPAPIRDVLMHLALTDLYRARWTEMIHEEWINAVLKNRPDLKRTQFERTRELMNAHVRDALIQGFEDLIPSLTLPDPGDCHVLAAAIRGRADVIVTYNLKHFPDAALAPYDIDVQHPDDFLTHVIDLAPGIVVEAIKRLVFSQFPAPSPFPRTQRSRPAPPREYGHPRARLRQVVRAMAMDSAGIRRR